MSLQVIVDRKADVVTVNGRAFSGDFFRALEMPEGTVLRVSYQDGKTCSLDRIDPPKYLTDAVELTKLRHLKTRVRQIYDQHHLTKDCLKRLSDCGGVNRPQRANAPFDGRVEAFLRALRTELMEVL